MSRYLSTLRQSSSIVISFLLLLSYHFGTSNSFLLNPKTIKVRRSIFASTTTVSSVATKPESFISTEPLPTTSSSTTTHPEYNNNNNSPTTTNNKPLFTEKWLDKYQQLIEFHSQHGHTLVPQKYKPNPSLGIWVRNQRYEYAKYQSSSTKKKATTKLVTERFERLNRLGFIWDAKEAAWDIHYNTLRRFYETYGHCNVPQQSQLGRWVRNQRVLYKHHTTSSSGVVDSGGGGCSMMERRRIRKLNSIRFCWDLKEAHWNEKYDALTKFYNRYGHSNVPSRYEEDPSLGRWVLVQRMQYKAAVYQQQHPSSSSTSYYTRSMPQMTPCRIEKLNQLGFVWDPKERYWWEQYEALKTFRNGHGHCVVPGNYDVNPKLGNWVSNQRQRMKEYVYGGNGDGGGRKGSLDERKVKALKEIGFWFLPTERKEEGKEEGLVNGCSSSSSSNQLLL